MARMRLAAPADAEALRTLRREAGWDVERVEAWIAASVADTRPMWVAEEDGEVAAMVALAFKDADPEVADAAGTATVTSLAVLQRFGRRGLGRALTLFVEDEARRRGVRVLTLNTRPTNVAALALYESLGYRFWKRSARSWGEAVFLRKTLA